MAQADSTTIPQGRWVRSTVGRRCQACGQPIPSGRWFLFFEAMPRTTACWPCGAAVPVEVPS